MRSTPAERYDSRMGRPSYVWDYDIDDETFQALLDGRLSLGRLDQDWATVRLLEHAPYREIVQRLGFRRIVEGWPAWRSRIRSQSRRRGFDFLTEWLPRHHPELLGGGDRPRSHG